MQKIAIIGGGPAGLTAAIDGAKNGLSVDLYEQYHIGDHIRCAEGFFDTLNMLGEPKAGVRFKVDEMKFKVKHEYVFPSDDQTNLWMIDRREWQIGLAEEARSLGVTIYENTAISKDKFKKLVQAYDWVIDSSGAPSITSKVYGFNHFYKETSGLTVQYTLLGDFSKYNGKIFAALIENYSGYYWIFPKSNHEANVGLIFFKNTKENLWDELEKVIEKEGLASYTKTKKLGGICPVVQPEKLVYGNALLTGDAAGLISALHGGGIDNACISGKIAIECIAKNEVDQYKSKINDVLGKKLAGETRLANLAYKLNPSILDKIVKVIHRSNKPLGAYAFLNGNGDAFEKIGLLKGIIPSILKN
ncbi:NAD(P)/FAD-dependent oxidoreductase [Rummeliibacillus pycnus]|uniref:NAD(P)/FAD-dependent oxidoreductase n=1 Tax=Rummeliibacillus pycnus TaxID=101070 RepID=UPI000C9B0F6C|nr:NAD(P)/FAD-dependent oxidoreductase [Rummeliibacillus pycnus]